MFGWGVWIVIVIDIGFICVMVYGLLVNEYVVIKFWVMEKR